MIRIFLLFVMTATAAPQTVVFDFGGVMTKHSHREIVVDFLRTSFQLSEEEFETVNAEKRRAVALGKTDEQFWLEFAKQKEICLPDTWAADFKRVLKRAINADPEMYDLVAQLKEKKIPVALLSNIDEPLSKVIRAFDLYAPFEPCLLSCETGVHKPDPRAYLILLDTLGLPAENVVFIDDKPENVEQAKKCGLDAILFESPEQLRQELHQRNL